MSLVAILDADKEGFLRSSKSLIQTIGRAARNVNGEVHMYGDTITPSMREAIDETNRRREIQISYNKEHGIDPKPLVKKIADITERLQREDADTRELLTEFDYGKGKRGFNSVKSDTLKPDVTTAPSENLAELAAQLTEQMHEAAEQLQFELAARLRDELQDIKKELRTMQRES